MLESDKNQLNNYFHNNIYLLIFASFLYAQDTTDYPDFINKENKSDIQFIIKYAPLPAALQRTEKLLKPWLEKKNWSRADEVIEWARDLFISKDPNFDTEYFDKIRSIINRDDTYRQRKPFFGDVNTSKDEYWPAIYYDLINNERYLFFTRYNGKHEDIFVSKYNSNTDKWAKGRPIKNLNTRKANEAVFSVSHDGSRLIIYRSKIDEKDNTDLYISSGVKFTWNKPEILPEPINGSDEFEGGGFITSDRKYILFSSDREGGVGDYKKKVGEDYGNQDLYVSTKMDDDYWSDPINLGDKINTPGAEITPFLSHDGLTLYFSSDGHPGMGGRDVFKSTRSNRNDWAEWTEPKNLGKYVNTVANDEGYKISPLNNFAYFDSENQDGNKDIYKLQIDSDCPPEIKRVKVKDLKDFPMEGVKVLAINPISNDTLGTGITDTTGIAILLIPCLEKKSKPGDGERESDIKDTDGDNIPDDTDNDIDGDGIPNELDSDDDGDGIPDTEEKDIGDDPNSAIPPYLITVANSFPVTADPRPDSIPPQPFTPNQVQPFRHELPIPQDVMDELLQTADSLGQDSIHAPLPPNSIKLIWPLKSLDSSHYAYDVVSVYMDHDPKTGKLKDYNCGEQTYDLDGYNHTGTDIMLWPFSWSMMDRGIIQVVAAAGGVIIDKLDGEFDRSCDLESSNGEANFVVIMHRDGSLALYFHLKKGSVLEKSIGDSVQKGEYLGLVGSSGQSTGPHLHFEFYDSDMNLTDPFGGPCSGPSWWENQKQYRDTGINHVMSHYAHPLIPLCPEPELIFESNNFFQGDSLYLTSSYRNILPGEISNHKVITPSGNKFYEFLTSTDEFYVPYPEIKSLKIPFDAETGKWTYSIDYFSKTYQDTFLVQEGLRPPKEAPDPIKDVDEIVLSVPAKLPIGSEYICADNDVYFDHNSDTLNTITKFILVRITDWLIKNNMHDVRITGYSSSIGPKDYNLKLSRKRAYNVKAFFDEQGIKYTHFKGKGEEEIIRDAWGRELEDKSRRVKICYRK